MITFFSKKFHSFSLHVGDRPKEEGLGFARSVMEDVEKVQADGQELEYIRRKFQNLPMCDGKVVVWTGDLARFIAINWF